MNKKSKIVIGLMSGTSADGIDSALVKIKERKRGIKTELIAFDCLRYSQSIKNFILDCSKEGGNTKNICKLNFLMGELFAQAACHIARQADFKLKDIDLIGSHGQTICHLPYKEKISGVDVSSTLQIGEAAIIAERTGIITVSDFRPRDIAVGGQGAPLTAYVDYLLFNNHKKEGRIILNIGGIANITALLPKTSIKDVLAFDTGPGNMIIDGLIRRVSGEKQPFDRNGAMAQHGEVDKEILSRLMEHPFLQKPPPKSTGREEFGEEYLHWIIELGKRIDWKDLICTATAFTATSISQACREFVFPLGKFSKMIVSGGGVHNKCLMEMLRDDLPQLQIVSSDEFQIPVDAKEAIAFAILANETIMQRPGNLPSATGAEKRVVLGKITL